MSTCFTRPLAVVRANAREKMFEGCRVELTFREASHRQLWHVSLWVLCVKASCCRYGSGRPCLIALVTEGWAQMYVVC